MRILCIPAFTDKSYFPAWSGRARGGTFKQLEKQLLSDGDIIMTKSNSIERVGSCAFFMQPEGDTKAYIAANFCQILRFNKSIIDPEYGFFWMISSATQRFLKDQATGTSSSLQNVNGKKIKSTPFAYPIINEQRRIVARIKECMERVEEIEKLQAENTKTVHILYKSRLVDLFDQMLFDSPFFKFGDLVAETKLGLVRSKKDQSEERSYPYVRMQDITNEGHLKTSSFVMVDANEKEIETSQLKREDFLFNTRNSYELVGKTAIVPELPRITLYNNNILRVRFKRDKVIPSFINHLFQHAFVKSQLEHIKNKTTSVCAIYWNKLATIEIPVPPLKVQERFVEHADSVSDLQRSIVAEMKDCEMVSKKLRKSILRKAFAGEL